MSIKIKVTQVLIIGLFLILSCNKQSELKMQLLIKGNKQIVSNYSSDSVISIDAYFFNTRFNSTISNPKFDDSDYIKRIQRLDTINNVQINFSDNQPDSTFKSYRILTQLNIDTLNVNSVQLTNNYNFSIDLIGKSEHEIQVITNNTDSNNYLLMSEFDISILDSLSDKKADELINYIISEAFATNYIKDINRFITSKY